MTQNTVYGQCMDAITTPPNDKLRSYELNQNHYESIELLSTRHHFIRLLPVRLSM